MWQILSTLLLVLALGLFLPGCSQVVALEDADDVSQTSSKETVYISNVVYDTVYRYHDLRWVSLDTTSIGNQTWIAQNIYFETSACICYENNPENCKEYGCLYAWEETSNQCPSGWKLPSREDFETLIEYVGGDSVANHALKSTYGWSGGAGGWDEYRFGVIPAGYRDENGTYVGLSDRGGTKAYFWTSTQKEDGQDSAYGVVFSTEKIDGKWVEYDVSVGLFDKNMAMSIRCIKE